MKTYTNEQRYMALRKMSIWMVTDPEKAEFIGNAMPDDENLTKTEAGFDVMCDAVCAAVEQIEPTVFAKEGFHHNV